MDDACASSPILVARLSLLAIALAMSWTIGVADIITAFLHAPLSEGAELNLIPPREFYSDGKTVWRLKRQCRAEAEP